MEQSVQKCAVWDTPSVSNRGQSEMKMCLAAKVTCRWSTQVNRRRGNKDVTDRPQMEI